MPEKKPEVNRILDYVTGLLYFYGVMDFESLYRSVTAGLPLSLDRQALQNILDKDMSDENSPYDIDCDDDLYYHFDVEDTDWVLNEQKSRAGLDYRPVTEKEAQLVANNRHRALWHPAVKKLDHYLQSRFDLSPEEALEKVRDGQDMYRNDVSPVEVVDTIIEDLHFETHEEAQSMINLVMDMVNSTPLWILKGWTPRESFERLEKQHLKPLPEKPFELPEQNKQEQLSLFKVGRNEPCPCGSGKKFKKCCDANVPEENSEQTPPASRQESPPRSEPSREEWSALYKAMAAYKEAGCWNWMDNDDLFGVMDPETGIIAYCCIMGCTGEHYGLGAYLGTEGLQSVLNMMMQEDDFSTELFFAQKCLMASFGDRDELTGEDRSVIKELGLTFRGRGNWPQYRSHEPGLYPWYISAWECRLLTLALQQAVEVSLQCRLDKSILQCDRPEQFLVRVPLRVEEKITWEEQCLAPPRLARQYSAIHINDELRLRKILSSSKKGKAAWEIDTFWMPTPIQENKKERPYYPKVFLIVDSDKGLIVRFEMIRSIEEEGHRFIEAMLKLLESGAARPSRILVEKDETYLLLEKACEQLDIPLSRVESLELLPEAREEMIQSILNRGR